jgi:UDP-glucose 4-epimerase
MKLLITGGAGYIGSHMVRYAQERDHDITILDDFSTGNEWAVNGCEVLNVNLLDKARLSTILHKRHFDGVIHFAAKSLVGESLIRPDLYYENNVVGTINLVNEMRKNGINNLVFSSTAAIFGEPLTEKIMEDHPKFPLNPYGKSKLMVEMLLSDICSAYNFNVTCLRYFNAAGAHFSGKIGEAHDPETHLIPIILKSISSGEGSIKVFGDDYSTPDGTCIRDYVHVSDLAAAHLLGLQYARETAGLSAFNLGTANGFSVMEVIRECERVTGKTVNFSMAERRGGDPGILVADNMAASTILKWQPKIMGLTEIISTAWDWECFAKKDNIFAN